MRLTADYHTHTVYSDGRCTVDEQVARAKELGLEEIAITDHGYGRIICGLRRKETARYRAEIAEAGARHKIATLVGIEGNILGREGTCDLREEDFEHFDLFLAGYHLASRHERFFDAAEGYSAAVGYHLGLGGGKRILRDQTRGYLNAVKRYPIDILTHINYRCFADAVEVAKCCRDYGTYVELNGRKTHFTDEELYKVAETGVRFVLDSDAHSPDRVGDIARAAEQLGRVGVPLSRIDNIDGRRPVFRFAEYKKRR